MPPKQIAPDIKLQGFSCPQCGRLADQTWFKIYADKTEGGKPPFVPDTATLNKFKEDRKSQPDEGVRKLLDRFIETIEVDRHGEFRFEKNEKGEYCNLELINAFASRCYSCGKLTFWRHRSVLHPNHLYEVEPNEDMDADIKRDFNEARAILDLSPRGAAALLRLCVQKLCKQLGQPGKNVNKDIAALVADGLDVKIQKALDIVRVVGNECVHPGTMDLRDDKMTAAKLFDLVNHIADDRISKPKAIEILYNDLPEDKRNAISDRDRS